MKFLVSDSQAVRHERIREFLTPESAVIAALLAAVDLEWTIRRVIDASANGGVNVVGDNRIAGLPGYAKAWGKVVNGPKSKRLQDVVGEWDQLMDDYQLRHDIVHGRQGAAGVRYVTQRVNRMLAASVAVAEYGAASGADPYRRLKRRILTGPTAKKVRVKK
jgi:hypothetical protein